MSLLWVTAAPHPYTQQDWYHGGLLDGGRTLHDTRPRGDDGMIHVGTRQAALDRIDPEKRSWGSDEYDQMRHARVYRVRLTPGTRVCPYLHSDAHSWRTEGPDRGERDGAGEVNFEPGHPAGECDPKADVHAYTNTAEDQGGISLRVNPRRLTVVEDLGRHPFFGGAT